MGTLTLGMKFAAHVLFLLIGVNPLQIGTKWPSKIDVGEKRKGDFMRAPGTRWCGQGDGADSVEDLGGYTGTDRCCRHHDLGCPHQIKPGESKGGITNHRLANAFHCSCDKRFRNCLRLEGSVISNVVGYLFFEVVNTPCFEEEEKLVCVASTWWGQCRGWKMVKHLTWRDLSWSATNTKKTSNTNGVVNKSRTESSLPKMSTTTKSVSNTSQSNQKPTQSNLSSKISNTGKNSLLQSKEILETTRTNQTYKSKKTDKNAARARNQALPSSIQQAWSSQQASYGVKATQEVNLPPKQTYASAPVNKQPRRAPTSRQMECHSHAGYKHCGVMSPGQDSMMVGLVGGYTALALIVAVSLISIWASKYLPFFLKMWWIKASSAQTYDVNT